MKVYYQSDLQREAIHQLLKRFGKIYESMDMVDIEYFCAYYLLTLESVREESKSYLEEELIDFNGLSCEFEDEDPRKYTIMVAWDLFNALGELKLMDLISKVNTEEWEYILKALDYRKKGLTLKEI